MPCFAKFIVLFEGAADEEQKQTEKYTKDRQTSLHSEDADPGNLKPHQHWDTKALDGDQRMNISQYVQLPMLC